jgi:hypothetical protein
VKPLGAGIEREPMWVESNDQKDAARALEMLHVQLISAVIDPYSWKWVFVVLHHSVRAFLVASLATGTDPAESEQDLIEIHDLPAERLGSTQDDLPELYERMKSSIGYPGSRETDQDIARMVTYRNAFVHQFPTRWKLKINELPRVAGACLNVVEFLGWNPGHIHWRKGTFSDLARVKSMASRRVLEALERQYQGL